jgi:hypothetical protein
MAMSFWSLVSEGVKGLPVSEVLRERLELAADKYDYLEKKFAESEARCKALEEENTRLTDRVAKLEKDVVQKHVDADGSSVATTDEPLDGMQRLILKFLGQHGETTETTIVAAVNVGLELAKYHLNELRSRKFVARHDFAWEPSKWSLLQDGRRYLAQHGMIE